MASPIEFRKHRRVTAVGFPTRLYEDDKLWVEQQAALSGCSEASIIREIVSNYRAEHDEAVMVDESPGGR